MNSKRLTVFVFGLVVFQMPSFPSYANPGECILKYVELKIRGTLSAEDREYFKDNRDCAVRDPKTFLGSIVVNCEVSLDESYDESSGFNHAASYLRDRGISFAVQQISRPAQSCYTLPPYSEQE